jgi:hypothetical protein
MLNNFPFLGMRLNWFKGPVQNSFGRAVNAVKADFLSGGSVILWGK